MRLSRSPSPATSSSQTIAPATALSQFDIAAGWTDVDLVLDYTPSTSSDPANIAVTLPAAPTTSRPYRLVLAGSGPTPVVGLVGGAPAPIAGGTDLTFTIGASS